MPIVIITMLTFFSILIAYTYYEDWRDSLWFYGTAGRGKKDPHNILWHTIKPHEAISGWLTGVAGTVWLYFAWTRCVQIGDYLTAALSIFVTLAVIWGVRVKLHQWFLRRFKIKYIGI